MQLRTLATLTMLSLSLLFYIVHMLLLHAAPLAQLNILLVQYLYMFAQYKMQPTQLLKHKQFTRIVTSIIYVLQL